MAGSENTHVRLSLCMQAAVDIRQQAEENNLADNRFQMISDNPFLRTDRFFSQIPTGELTTAQQKELTQRYLAFGSQALRHEFINLPVQAQKRFNEKYNLSPKILIEKCGNEFLSHFISQVNGAEPKDIDFKSNYSLGKRILGIYPLYQWTTLFARMDYRYEMNKRINNPPVFKNAQYYQLADQDFILTRQQVKNSLDDAIASSELNIPVVGQDNFFRLFNYFSPIWKVDTVDFFDRIGEPIVNSQGIPNTNAKPKTYFFPSYTNLNGKTLLQLNYVIWFSERPRMQLIDLYRGNLDSVIWRVTLDSDGSVLLYDTIHSCGCYYKQYPVSDRLKLKSRIRGENPLTYPGSYPDGYNGRVIVPITSGSHYALQPYTEDSLIADIIYNPVAYDQLNYINVVENRRVIGKTNLFGENNLVNGSQRLERFLLWPFGIASPGAMRQAGHHPIAFIGKRHFDDPDLLKSYFHYNINGQHE